MSTANPRMAGLAPDEVECLHAAARALRDAGVRRVDAWVCARVA